MHKKNHKMAVGVGVGLAALAAAAAGAAYLYGTEEGSKKREEIKGWMFKMRADVLEKMEKVKGEFDQSVYSDIIDQVAMKYAGLKNIEPSAIQALAKDLKKHWNTIKGQMNEGAKAPAKPKAVAAKKTAKKTTTE